MYYTSKDQEWRSYVGRLPDEMRDVHFLPGMVAPYEATGMGKGFLYVEQEKDKLVLWPTLEYSSDNKIRHAYNFGGPIGTLKPKRLPAHEAILVPFLADQQKCLLPQTEYIKDVVWVDLTKPFKFRRDTRQRIEQADVSVDWVPATDTAIDQFVALYQEAMKRLQAATHWRFSGRWFYALFDQMKGHVDLMLAWRGSEVVAGCVLLHGYGTCYYHFSAGIRPMPPGAGHRMLSKAMEWSQSQGHKRFHLGGGVKPNDGLFMFKSGFSDLRLPVYVYKDVTCEHSSFLKSA